MARARTARASDFHRATILVDDGMALGRGFELDGVPVKGVRTVTAVTRTLGVTTVTVELVVQSIETRVVEQPSVDVFHFDAEGE